MEIEESDSWVDEWLAQVERENRARALRRNNPYLLHLIKVLWPRDMRGLRRLDVIERVWNIRNPSGLPMPKKFEETLQSTFNHYSAQSLVFQKRGGRPDEELFYSVGRKGSGIWAVHRERAKHWLLTKGFDL